MPTLMRESNLMKSRLIFSAMMSELMTITPHDGIPSPRPPPPAALAVRR